MVYYSVSKPITIGTLPSTLNISDVFSIRRPITTPRNINEIWSQINFRECSELDIQNLINTGFDKAEELLENKIVIEAKQGDNKASLYIDKTIYEQLGEDYIRKNLIIKYSKSLGEYFIKLRYHDMSNNESL